MTKLTKYFAAAGWFQNPLGPDKGSLLGIICNVRDGLFPLLLLIGLFAFLTAGLLYLSSGGNEQRIGQAKKALSAAVIGVALAFLAFGLPPIVAELFNVDPSSLPKQCQ